MDLIPGLLLLLGFAALIMMVAAIYAAAAYYFTRFLIRTLQKVLKTIEPYTTST